MLPHLSIESNCFRGNRCGLGRRIMLHYDRFIIMVMVCLFGAMPQASASLSELRHSDEVTAEDRAFWSFKKPVRPEIPAVKDEARARTSIDHFILGKLETEGLGLNEDADNRTMIRRVTYNLTGLPPEPEEVEAFARNPDPKAYEHLVDRLLASPRYGERWGRHWLDVAGFAESSFFIGDQIRPEFWRYRDYVIRSFNDDKPYDVFVREQLAGDEMFDWRNTEVFTEDQVEKLVATGFLRCTPDATDNQPITQEEKIFAAQQAVVEVSVKALMGLAFNCFRCHSGKYNPVSHEEYYKLTAFFQPAFDPEQWLAGIWTDTVPGPIRAIPLTPRSEREAYFAESYKWRDENFALRDQISYELPRKWRDRYLKDHSEKIEDDGHRNQVTEILGRGPGNRLPDEEDLLTEVFEVQGITTDQLKELYPEYEQQDTAARDRIKELVEETKELPPLAWGTFDVSTSPSPTPLLRRGNFETPGEPIAPGVLAILDDPEQPFDWEAAASKSPPTTTGRRLALAEWITNPNHPLTARVMVNRIWQYHFGEGLVRTPDDFGVRGSRPTHPELLDWLSVEFMESGWSIKHLHRLILRSTVYRQSSRVDRALEAADPANHFWSRFPKRRLEAEAIRDAMLAVSGQLDLRMFGESVPTERLDNDGRVQVPPDHPDRGRRSVYVNSQRTGIPGFLTTFDAPILDTNAPKRPVSAIPQQALAAMNNPFMHDSAGSFWDRIVSEGLETLEERLNRIWMLAYSRSPTGKEINKIKAWLGTVMNANISNTGESQDAWKTVCHAVLSSNEFIYID